MALGFALSLASAALFGAYVLPRRASPLGAWAYAAAMGEGVALLSAALWAVLALLGHGRPPARALPGAAASAVAWLVANQAYILAIDRLGVARASAVKNLAAVFGTGFGIALGERFGPLEAAAAALGSALVVVAALAVGAARPAAGTPPAARRAGGGLDPWGLAWGLAAAVGIGGYLVPALRLVDSGPWGFLQYQAVLGLVGGAGSALPHAVRRLLGRAAPLRRADRRLPWLAGLLWTAASAMVTPATSLVGLAVAWPLSQLSFFVTLAWGAVRLREIDVGRSRAALLAGSACTAAALALLGWARFAAAGR